MSWSTLSEDIWKCILEYVPLTDRLNSCSVVNKTIYRAAAAATCVVESCDVHSPAGLCQWMTLHGQHLTSLQLQRLGVKGTQLPCPNLRELDLTFIDVQLGGSSTQPGVLPSCTRLTFLRLNNCYFTSTDDQYGSSLAALSVVVNLRHLELMDGRDAGGSWMPSAVLQHLSHLTYLDVYDQAGHMLGTSSLQHASCLTNLQELHIASFGGSDRRISLSPSTTPGLSRLTALKKVALQGVSLDATVLEDCTQLQGLMLQWVNIISAGGAAALHSLLGCLQQLQSLQLHALEYDLPVAAAAYTSLTASSALQQLHLTVDNMPAGVWRYVFPPDRQLPALQELTLDWSGGPVEVPIPPPAAAPGTDDLSSISVCCPGLCSISIFVQPDTQLADLTKVSSLTSLYVSELHEEGFESLRALSALVSLQELSVDLGGPITPRDLLCLTALRPLTRLCIDRGMAPEFEGADDVTLDIAEVRTMLGNLPMSRSVAQRHLFAC